MGTQAKRRGLVRRAALCGAALLLGCGSGAAIERLPAARSAQTDGASALLLAYAPSVFDLAVYLGRSVAVVTYGSRELDPVTNSFVVRDLRIERDGFALEIGRWRLGATTQAIDGLVLDTRPLPLDFESRDLLRRLGAETLRGNLVASLDADVPSASFDFDLSLDVENVGRLDLGLGLDGFHVLVPLDQSSDDDDDDDDVPEVRGSLRFATLEFADRGLVDALIETVARAEGSSPETTREGVGFMAATGLQGAIAGLPGGGDPELARRAAEWGTALQSFIADPDRVSIVLDPEEPVSFESLTSGEPSADTLLALNPSVSNGPVSTLDLIDPAAAYPGENATAAERLAAATSLVEGLGVPQDIPGGFNLVLADARNGDAGAIRLAARALALDPDMPVVETELTGLLAALLVVEAMDAGGPSDPAGLAALRERLDPATIAIAESEAANAFADAPMGLAQAAREAAAFEARDFAAMRRFAFDYYEGRGLPRSVTRAYGLASVAAAGGDALGRSLRDDIARGARSGALRLDLDAAREGAMGIWTGAVVTGGEAGAAPAPSDDAAPPSPDRRRAPDPQEEGN